MSAQILSNRELAGLLEIGESAVRKNVAHPDWPFGQAPWKQSQLESIKTWRAANLKPDQNDLENKEQKSIAPGEQSLSSKLRDQLTYEKIKALRIQNQKDDQKLHDVHECRIRRVQQVHRLKAELLALPKRVTKKVRSAGSDAEAMAFLLGEIEMMIAKFAQEPTTTPPASTPTKPSKK